MLNSIIRIGRICFIYLLVHTSLLSQNFGLRDINTGRIQTVSNYGEPNQTFLREADVKFQKLDLEGTFFALENAVAQNPNSADALLRRAVFKQRIGMESEAAEDFKLASRINPYAADLYGYNGNYSLLSIMAYEPAESLTEMSWTSRIKDYHAWFHQYLLDEEAQFDELDLIESVLFEAEDENFDAAQLLLDSLVRSFPNSGAAYDLNGLFSFTTFQFILQDS